MRELLHARLSVSVILLDYAAPAQCAATDADAAPEFETFSSELHAAAAASRRVDSLGVWPGNSLSAPIVMGMGDGVDGVEADGDGARDFDQMSLFGGSVDGGPELGLGSGLDGGPASRASSAACDRPLLRVRVARLSLRLKLRSPDSRVFFAAQDFDVENLIAPMRF